MRYITILYIFLLTYVIAALVFWGLSLDKQNKIIYEFEKAKIGNDIDSIHFSKTYHEQLKIISENKDSKSRQYFGEGLTFLLIILLGGFIVYTSIRGRDKLSAQQNNFMLSITHELKSPIAAIKLNLQTLARRNLDEATKNKLIERSITESDRLNDLCNNLLLASQLENQHFTPTMQKMNLSSLVNESVEIYINREQHKVIKEIQEGIYISGDQLLWQLVVNNLMENASKYSPPKTLIVVKLFQQEYDAILQIIDEGQGIPEVEKEKIFQKFYRIGSEESRKTKGTGLGLYLTSKIVKEHKGHIIISDHTPNGSVFETTVPIWNEG